MQRALVVHNLTLIARENCSIAMPRQGIPFLTPPSHKRHKLLAVSVDGYDYEGVEIYDPFREGLGTSHPGWIHYSMTMLAEHPSLTLEHNMIPKFMSVAFAAASALLIAVPATAVGDIPVKLSQRQAAEIYFSIRWLLAADGKTCPAGQVVAAGIVTGGSTPAGGSQATTIMFNHCGKIVINRTWDSGIGNRLTVSTKIDC